MTPHSSKLEHDSGIPDLEQLRRAHYNARVCSTRPVHDELCILRVQPDGGPLSYRPGQYTLLGLGSWEPRIDGVCDRGHIDAPNRPTLIRRAYSISCPIFDEQGRPAPCGVLDYLEFYLTAVYDTVDEPLLLTPRLFALQPGDRLFLGPQAHGKYSLDPVDPNDDVLFLATGTGEAPHNAMIAELLFRGHAGRVISCVCVRYRRDLGYLAAHRELERRYPNYRYVPLTTREPENVDPQHADYIGRRRLQEFFASGEFEQAIGRPLDPQQSHAYLCGNPAMIGAPRKTRDGQLVFPEPPGMVELLVDLGFQLEDRRHPGRGNVHYEKYW
jgi:ferredoxin/flavodoxin---NADP+ reductase